MKDMFRLLVSNDFGIPGEVEFEHHIANTFLDDLLKEGNVFPFTRLCRAGNPREKYAENPIQRFKRLSRKEKAHRGRPFARNEANRLNDNISATRTFDDIVAIQESKTKVWNNSLHPNQQKYKDKTRWQVLVENVNPNLAQLKRLLIAQYIGEATNTTIKNNKVLRVQHANYWLPKVDSITLFDNYSVTAYYLRDEDGTIPEVYVYQNGEYKCTCAKSLEYVNSQFEQTDEDVEIMHQQFGYRTSYEALVKKGTSKLARMKVLENRELVKVETLPDKELPVLPAFEAPVKKKINYTLKAEEDL